MSVEYAFNPAAAQFADDLHALYATRHAEVATRLASPDTSLVTKLHVAMGELTVAQLTGMGLPVEVNFLRATPQKTAKSMANAMHMEGGSDARAAMRLSDIAVNTDEPITERLQAMCSLAIIVGGSRHEKLGKKEIIKANYGLEEEADLAIQFGVLALESQVLPQAEEDAISRNLADRKMNGTFFDPARASKTIALVNRLALSRYCRMAMNGLFAEDASRKRFWDDFEVSSGMAPKPRDEHRAARIPVYPVNQSLSPPEQNSTDPKMQSKTASPSPNEPADDDPNQQQFSYRSRWQEAVGANWNGSYIEQVEGPDAVGFAGYRILYLPDMYQGQPIETGVAVHPQWGNAMYIFPGERGVDPTTGEVVRTPQEVFLTARQRRAVAAFGAIRLVHHSFRVYEDALDLLTTPPEHRSRFDSAEAERQVWSRK